MILCKGVEVRKVQIKMSEDPRENLLYHAKLLLDSCVADVNGTTGKCPEIN